MSLICFSTRGVSTQPGQIALQVTPLPAASAVIEHAHFVLALEPAADFFDFLCIAEAVQHDIRAKFGEFGGDAEPDAAGRSGDDGNPAVQHEKYLSMCER
jgi:hypothetical protein